MNGNHLGMLVSINVGLPALLEHDGREVMTGIRKQPVGGAAWLSCSGLSGDGQADPVHHGGPDKAVCVYSADHAPYWRQRWGKEVGDAAFGENFTVTGALETEVCIGDVVRVGGALLQVSQARLPCFKLALRHGLPSLPQEVQDTGFTGFYFRVLEEGTVKPGDALVCEARHPDRITVREGAAVMLSRKDDLPAARRLYAVDALADSWKATLAARIARLEQEEVAT